MVLLEILIKRDVRKLEHSSDGCVEKGNAHKKNNVHRNWDTFSSS